MNNIEHILQTFGYIYTGSCRCDGHYTKKYRKPKSTFVIKWRVHRQAFKVMDGYVTLYELQNILNLQRVLNELATKNIQA